MIIQIVFGMNDFADLAGMYIPDENSPKGHITTNVNDPLDQNTTKIELKDLEKWVDSCKEQLRIIKLDLEKIEKKREIEIGELKNLIELTKNFSSTSEESRWT